MDLFPAIDLRDGRCVRLSEGDFDRQTVYWDDPKEVADGFYAAGARWVHMVDLDAAKTGKPVNRNAIVEVARAQAGRMKVQTGGGVRSLSDAAELLDAGVARVVLGTAAVENPPLINKIAERWPGGVAVGFDHRDGEVRLRGWLEGSGKRVVELIPDAVSRGASAVIVTDIGRDGMLSGADVTGLAGLLEATGAPLIASGGVSDLDDLRALASIRHHGHGLAGVIVGKAIYEKRFNVAEAVAACRALSGDSSP